MAVLGHVAAACTDRHSHLMASYMPTRLTVHRGMQCPAILASA